MLSLNYSQRSFPLEVAAGMFSQHITTHAMLYSIYTTVKAWHTSCEVIGLYAIISCERQAEKAQHSVTAMDAVYNCSLGFILSLVSYPESEATAVLTSVWRLCRVPNATKCSTGLT